MNIDSIAALLKSERSISVDTAYYRQIALWRDWWRGCSPPFHVFLEKGADGTLLERRLYSLKMAKKVCEDWASLLLNEKTSIVLGDRAASAFLQGEDGHGGVLAHCGFWQHANELIERAFYSGTGAFLLRLFSMSVSERGRVIKSEGASLTLEYLPAANIIPITVRQGTITEAAFCSELIENGRRLIYLETHTLEESGYVVENRYFCSENGRLTHCPLPVGMAARIETGSKIPLFSILRPNILNSIDEGCGLGISIFAGALDCLEGVDLAFNNLCRDFRLGGKKVFLNRSLVQSDGAGRLLTPDDVCRQLFLTIGERMPDETQLIYEHNPSLRVEENVRGISAQLDYLSFRCGLGPRHYRFENGAVATATQYVGDRQELVQNIGKHSLSVRSALVGIVRAMLWAGEEVLGERLDSMCTISVRFEDSVFLDRETERERDRRDVLESIMPRFEYRMKWYDEDEKTARRMAAQSDSKGEAE